MQPRFLPESLRLASTSLLRPQSDERLVRLVRAGSQPAFAELVHRHRPALVRYAGQIVGEARAEDVVQLVLAKAHTALTADDRPIDVKPWLYRITHNAALNELRGNRELLVLDDHADRLVVDGAEAQAGARERLRSTLRAIQALPVPQRDALLLREFEGRSHSEIATALGVTPGAARQHLARARVTMRAAVTAVTPYPLALKLAALGTGGAGLPAAEVAVRAGTGLGLSKLAATAMATAALAGGAVVAPSVLPDASPRETVERPAGGTPPSREVGSALAVGPGGLAGRPLITAASGAPTPVRGAQTAAGARGAAQPSRAGSPSAQAESDDRTARRDDEDRGRDGSHGRDAAIGREGDDPIEEHRPNDAAGQSSEAGGGDDDTSVSERSSGSGGSDTGTRKTEFERNDRTALGDSTSGSGSTLGTGSNSGSSSNSSSDDDPGSESDGSQDE